jgi:hypothetical protein
MCQLEARKGHLNGVWEERMRKTNAVLIAIIGILFAMISVTAGSAYGTSCSSTCSSSKGRKAEKFPACSGKKVAGQPEKNESSRSFLVSYFEMRALLAQDVVEGLDELSLKLAGEAKEFRLAVGEKESSSDRLEALETIEKAALAMEPTRAADRKANRLDSAREHFRALSNSVIAYVKEYGFDGAVYSFHCPMAKHSWLQETDRVGNPYYGSKMLKCGTMTGRIVEGRYTSMSGETEKSKIEGKQVQQEHGDL